MKLTFFGTSAGCHTKTRNVTGLALSRSQSSFWSLFDCGEGTQHQIQLTSLTLYKLRRIFITHLHGDHVYGLWGILNSRCMEGAKSSIELFGPKGIKELITTILRLSESYLTYELHIHEISDEGESFQFDEEIVSAVPLSHNVTSFAYVIKENDRDGKLDISKAFNLGVPSGPMLGKLKKGESITLESGEIISGLGLIGPKQEGRKIIICGDNDQPSLLAPHLKNCQLLVHEATYTEKVKNAIPVELKHSTAKMVSKVSQDNNLPNLILTHFSVRFRDTVKENNNAINEIYNEATAHFKAKLFLAEDFDEYNISVGGVVTLLNRDERKYELNQERVASIPMNLTDFDINNARFAIDSGLGKLAKNMRILGFDVIYSNDSNEFVHIIERAKKEKRLILTRNRKLLKELLDNFVILMKDLPLSEQLKYLMSKLGLTNKLRPLSRCIDCNTVLLKVSKESVKNQVPPKVFLLNDVFSTCSQCHKIYWRGSHYRRMHDFISRL